MDIRTNFNTLNSLLLVVFTISASISGCGNIPSNNAQVNINKEPNIKTISSVAQQKMQNSDKGNRNLPFRIKSTYSGKAEESYEGILYKGDWNNIVDSFASGDFYSSAKGPLENDNSTLSYLGSWSNISDTNASGESYSKNSGSFILLADNYPITTGLIYGDGANSWSNVNTGTSNSRSFNNSPLIIDNTNTSSTYNLRYYSSAGSQVWSPTITGTPGGWSNYLNYTFNNNDTGNTPTSIEFQFTGTNVELYGRKGLKYGMVRVSVFPETSPGSGVFSNTPEKVVDNIDMFNIVPDTNNLAILPDSDTRIAKIQGLKSGLHKVKFEPTGTKNPLAIDDVIDFDYAKVYPSVEYTFTEPNVRILGWKFNNGGYVDVSLDGGTVERIDTYDPATSGAAVSSLIKDYRFLSTGSHRITVESTGSKNPSSGSTGFYVDKFESYPEVKGSFTGSDFDLNVVKDSNKGLIDLYIDNVFKQTIDLYNSGLSYTSVPITGLTHGNHNFTLFSKGSKNTLSSGLEINFDSINYSKLSYTFFGTSIDYIAYKGWNQGKVNIYIDNVFQEIMTCI